MWQYRDDDHRKDAPHFIIKIQPDKYSKPSKPDKKPTNNYKPDKKPKKPSNNYKPDKKPSKNNYKPEKPAKKPNKKVRFKAISMVLQL